MTCDCGSDKFVSVSGKTSDLGFYQFGTLQREGYVPAGLGIGAGSYLRFKFCISCGKIADFKPLTPEQVTESFGEEYGW